MACSSLHPALYHTCQSNLPISSQKNPARISDSPVKLSFATPRDLQFASCFTKASPGGKSKARRLIRAQSEDASDTRTAESLIVSFGEMLIDFVPTVNGVSLADAPAFLKAPGGAPANVAVGVSRLGGRSAFIGKVGEDEFGHLLCNILKYNHVETKGVKFDEGARTALAFVTLKEDGEREFMFYRNPSADMLLTPQELDLDLIKQADIVHYGSISLIAEPCKSAHLALMDAATSGNALLSYDPNLRLPLWPSAEKARTEILGIWNRADIIKISEEEIGFLTEGGDPYSDEVARSLWHDNLKLLVVTEGEKGCRYYTDDFQGRIEGWHVKAIDATGAGDAFVSGLLYQIAKNPLLVDDETKLREALFFSNACGALTTTKRGAIPALPDLAEVKHLMETSDYPLFELVDSM